MRRGGIGSRHDDGLGQQACRDQVAGKRQAGAFRKACSCETCVIPPRSSGSEGRRQSSAANRATSLAAGVELLGHLERDHGTEAKASEEIRALGLNGAYLVEIVRGHGLDGGMRRAPAVEALGLQGIYRLIRAQQLRKPRDK